MYILECFFINFWLITWLSLGHNLRLIIIKLPKKSSLRSELLNLLEFNQSKLLSTLNSNMNQIVNMLKQHETNLKK